ncbi:trypsin-like serine peptidase [Sinorhizobium meliloti]|uniref:trypsin-like serine peptidase n=1 Tax=Rhizobium meliloti TaxID=382 RepID=UPI000488E1C2|nr:serine protease [Sinorhizobium meliloti]UFX12243.1 serine protease [Sinorhizobium meliloti]
MLRSWTSVLTVVSTTLLAGGDASAVQSCEFDLFRVPETGLGIGVPLAAPPKVADGSLAEGSAFLEPGMFPVDRFATLDTLVDGVNRYCTAQSTEFSTVMLTAAHCVQDASSAKWVSDFQMRRIGEKRPTTNPKCMVVPKAWVNKPADVRFNWPADYAFVLMREQHSTSFFRLGDGTETRPVTAFGTPSLLGKHERLVAIPGLAEVDPEMTTFGTVRVIQEDATLGMSGGAWVTQDPGSKIGEGVVIGLSTTSFSDAGVRRAAGPRFDHCASEMLEFLMKSCR